MTDRRILGAGCLVFCVIAFVIGIGSIFGVLMVGSQIMDAEEISERVIVTEGIFVYGGLALIGVITGLIGLFLSYLLLRSKR